MAANQIVVGVLCMTAAYASAYPCEAAGQTGLRPIPSDVPAIPNPPVLTDSFRTRYPTPVPDAADSLEVLLAALHRGLPQFQEWDRRELPYVRISWLPGGEAEHARFLEGIPALRGVRLCFSPESPCEQVPIRVSLHSIDIEPDYHEYARVWFVVPRTSNDYEWSMLMNPIHAWTSAVDVGIVPLEARYGYCCYVARSYQNVGAVAVRRPGPKWAFGSGVKD